jgi:hypothetical protein
MKFTYAWAEIAKQNLMLKIALACLSLCAVLFSIVSLKLALREPLVIERTCYSKVAKTSDPRRTKEEIEAFVRIALEQRFNTEAKLQGDFVSANESAFRVQEQKELAAKQIKQRILVNSVAVEDAEVTIDADRILTVGSIRSALPFLLKAKVESQERSDGNPYGLILSGVKPIKQESK